MSRFKQYMSIIQEMDEKKQINKPQSVENHILASFGNFLKIRKNMALFAEKRNKVETYWNYSAGELTSDEIKYILNVFNKKKNKEALVKEFIENKDVYGLNLIKADEIKNILGEKYGITEIEKIS